MEYLPQGSLRDIPKKEPLLRDEAKMVLRQTLGALEYIHEKHIAHRDVKPANILVKSRIPTVHIKLCDFGLATDSDMLKTFAGTLVYMSAEIWDKSYTRAVDIWSVGVIGVQYLIGLPKFPEEDQSGGNSVWVKRLHKRLRGTADPATPLLTRMLGSNPNTRPSAKDCLSHWWFQDFQLLELHRESESQNRPPAEACLLQGLQPSQPCYDPKSSILSGESTEILTEVEDRAPNSILVPPAALQKRPRSQDPEEQELKRNTSKLRNRPGPKSNDTKLLSYRGDGVHSTHTKNPDLTRLMRRSQNHPNVSSQARRILRSSRQPRVLITLDRAGNEHVKVLS